MEWCISVNEMLHDVITKLNYTLIPPGFHGDVRRVRVMQDSLSKVIDQLGEQSRAAQGLNKVITTADKLRTSTSHTLYLLKDPTALGGKGEVIGMLKVGRKHLFLFSPSGRVLETEPLCVLDFLVLPGRQRRGHGRHLLDYMLKDMNVKVEELAIDGPSPKMERFLCKNYGLTHLLRQNNNFAVAPSFFDYLPSTQPRKAGSSEEPPSPALGRFAAPKPPSAISSVIHGDGTAYYEEGGTNHSAESEWPVSARAQSVVEAAPERPRSVAEADTPPEPAAEEPAVLEEKGGEMGSGGVGGECGGAVARPVSLALGRGAGDTSPARPDSQLTTQGYFDIKFYHNKLW